MKELFIRIQRLNWELVGDSIKLSECKIGSREIIIKLVLTSAEKGNNSSIILWFENAVKAQMFLDC